MLIALTNTKRGVTDLDVGVQWFLPRARQFGEADIQLPRSDHLWSTDFVNPNGGSLVELYHPLLGTWVGLTLSPSDTDSGIRFKASHLASIFQYRIVGRNRKFTNATAGQIVQAAFYDAMAGNASLPIVLGPCVEAAPIIPEYQFTGQPFAQVLADLSDKTGQEWEITTNGVFRWIASTGTYYESVLVQGVDVVEVRRETSITETATEVIATASSGQSYTAKVTDSSIGTYWQHQVALSVNTNNLVRLGLEANNRLVGLSSSPVTYKVKIIEDHWALREGDYVRMILPQSAISGETVLARVVSRQYRSNDSYLTMELNLIREFTANTPISVGTSDSNGVFVPYTENVSQLLSSIYSGINDIKSRTVSVG